MNLLTYESYVQMPWRNGLGVTTEIYKIIENEQLLLRISSAKVDHSGPFSVFENYDRTLVNFGPGNIKLNVDQMDFVTLKPWDVFGFEGSRHTYCEVDQPNTDFNVFALSNSVKVSTLVKEITPSHKLLISGEHNALVYVVVGKINAVSLQNTRSLVARARDSILFESNHSSGEEWELSPAFKESTRVVLVSWEI